MSALQLYQSGLVRRWHTKPSILNPENVAAHSWFAAVLILQYYPQASRALLKRALVHDIGEVVVGDLPFLFKKDASVETMLPIRAAESRARLLLGFPDEPLNEREQPVLREADTLSAYFHALIEFRSGSIYGLETLRHFKLEDYHFLTLPAQEIDDAIHRIGRAA